MSENKRNYFRVPFSQETKVRMLVLDENTFQITLQREVPVSIEDLGGGGACLVCREGLDEKNLLDFDFTLGNRKYTVMGRVVWGLQVGPEKFRYGIKFESLDEDERGNIIMGLNNELMRQRKLGKV